MSALPQNSSPSPFLKQDGAATKSNAIDIPSITLPKGGGALKGIDEKFSVNAFNGTGSFSIPLPVSPSRGGFQPSLSLSYNSGGGNNIFGLGWEVGFPSIQRKTDRKLPTYHDRDEGDVFLFSGAEDLVPVTSHPTSQQGNFEIEAYRPRIEGLFARIEKVIPSTNKKKFYWKITTKENVVTFFGISDACRISDPQDDTRIYQWLPEISFDDKGNFMHFIYKHEDKMNIYASLHEQHRIDGTAPFTNRYLKRIKYGNKSPFFPGYVADPSNANALYESPTLPTEFMFEIVFDYGEHIDDSAAETTFWKARKDAFSNYKPGFEIRTYRLCERVMVFHKFSELNSGIQTLVRSLEMKYDQSEDPLLPVEVTYLTEIRQKGYTRKAGMTYSESLPPLSFEYQRLKWNKKVHHINKEDLTHAPTGLSGDYQWTDFYNEGIPGILTEQANALYYKSNLGQGHFSQAQLVSPKPSFTGIQTGALQLMDLDANGRNQIVSYQQGLSGYFELTSENDWLPFREFEQMPSIDMNDPNTRLIDL
ncbi:MAG: SpvB/TcaC N-terminal domain-containing protein, partial [Cyclobacteriaceae bacterium]